MHEPSHTEKDPLTKVAGGKICKQIMPKLIYKSLMIKASYKDILAWVRPQDYKPFRLIALLQNPILEKFQLPHNSQNTHIVIMPVP